MFRTKAEKTKRTYCVQ